MATRKRAVVESIQCGHDSDDMIRSANQDGFATFDEVIENAALGELRVEADRLLAESPHRGGARNALQRSPSLRRLSESSSLRGLADAVLGASARPVKLTVFDKTAQANWTVPWHQDVTIAVAERREAPGFGPWTQKDGIPHVQPPIDVLERIVSLRLHLDDTPEANGALRVIPETHRLGRIAPSEIRRITAESDFVSCPVPAGGAMLMYPLLLHASSPSVVPARRRVLHFEFSSGELPFGLQWSA